MMKKFPIFHCRNTVLGRSKDSCRNSLINARHRKLITDSERAENSDSDYIRFILDKLLLVAVKEVNIFYEDCVSTSYVG